MRRKGTILILCYIITILFSACRNTINQEMTTEAITKKISEETIAKEDTLVWRIVLPDQTGKEMIQHWEQPLNKLLREKGASYSVQIKELGSVEGQEGSLINSAGELEHLRTEGEQTDLISLLSPMQFDDLAGYHLPYLECVEKELLQKLDDFLETEKGKVLKAAILQKDLKRARINEGIYGLSSVLPSMQAVMFSTEKMKEFGIEPSQIKADLFENETLLQTVKEKLGEPPYVLRNGDVRRKLGLWILNPTSNVAFGSEGRFVNIAETKEFRDYLKKLLDWKEKGLLRIFKYSSGAEKLSDSFVQDISDNNYAEDPYKAVIPVDSGNGSMENMSVYVVPNTSEPVIDPYWGDNKTGIASWTKQPEKAQDFLMRLFSDPDIANLIQYGVLQKDYILDQETVKITKEVNVVQRFFGYQYTNPMITYSTGLMTQDKYGYSEKFYEKYEQEIPDGFRFDPEPVLSQIVQTNQVFGDLGGSDTAVKIVGLEMEDLEQVIKELTEELKNAGIDEIVAEANRQLEIWQKEQQDSLD